MSQGRIDSKVCCIGCGSQLDGYTEINDNEARPSDGDLSICFYCASIGKYSDGVTNLKPLTDTELEDIYKEDPELYAQMQKVIKAIKNKKDI